MMAHAVAINIFFPTEAEKLNIYINSVKKTLSQCEAFFHRLALMALLFSYVASSVNSSLYCFLVAFQLILFVAS